MWFALIWHTYTWLWWNLDLQYLVCTRSLSGPGLWEGSSQSRGKKMWGQKQRAKGKKLAVATWLAVMVEEGTLVSRKAKKGVVPRKIQKEPVLLPCAWQTALFQSRTLVVISSTSHRKLPEGVSSRREGITYSLQFQKENQLLTKRASAWIKSSLVDSGQDLGIKLRVWVIVHGKWIREGLVVGGPPSFNNTQQWQTPCDL